MGKGLPGKETLKIRHRLQRHASGEGTVKALTLDALQNAGVTNLNFMVAISYGRGVVLWERYYGNITGEKFAKIVKEKFPNSANPRGKRVLQDNCPKQNSAAAKKAIYDVHGKIFTVPARSPDLNCIENFFALVGQKLRNDSIQNNITCESKEEFEECIKSTMRDFSHEEIDKSIESMPKRVDLVLKHRGNRIKY